QEPRDHGALLRGLLGRPNICARNWIARQYYHEVQGGSVVKPLVGKGRDVPSDAAVVRPILESRRGLAVSQALNPWYSRIDTYDMTAATIDEALRKVLAVGGDPAHVAGVDNFCWPTIQYHPEQNPDGKYKAAQLVRSNWALRDICLAFEIPLLSGKDSMYIDGNLAGPYGERRKVSGLPALLFTACSLVDDITLCVTMDAKTPGDLVYVLGDTRNELGGGEYYQMMGAVGLHAPKVTEESFRVRYEALHGVLREGLAASCHAVARGGLAVHLALVAMAGETGMEVDLEAVPGGTSLTTAQTLYSESCGRFILTVPRDNRRAFEEAFAGQPGAFVGEVTAGGRFRITRGDRETVVSEDVMELKSCWKRPFEDLI
ncbi:MAG: phosphoribosylformylglycinamidine synthase, partial [Deltaproteobacteria bacterium]